MVEAHRTIFFGAPTIIFPAAIPAAPAARPAVLARAFVAGAHDEEEAGVAEEEEEAGAAAEKEDAGAAVVVAAAGPVPSSSGREELGRQEER